MQVSGKESCQGKQEFYMGLRVTVPESALLLEFQVNNGLNIWSCFVCLFFFQGVGKGAKAFKLKCFPWNRILKDTNLHLVISEGVVWKGF